MKTSHQSSVINHQFSRLIICILLLFTFHFLLFTFSFAEEKAISLEEIVVTAAKMEEAIEETTSNVIVIKNDYIKKMNVNFITDVLRKIPELNLVQNGGPGGNATLLLRGAGSSQTLILIDGIKVNSTNTGSFDFSGITVDDIERIELVKGPQSTVYGSEAMAGVINIITKKGTGKPKTNVSLESGSFGTYKSSMTFSGGVREYDYRATASYFSTDGISSAKGGTERDGYRNANFSGKFGIKPAEKFELEFSGRHYYGRSEFDDFDFFKKQAVDAINYVQHLHHYSLSGKGKLFISDTWEQILTASIVRDSLKGRDPDTIFNNYDIISQMETIDWQHNFYLINSYTLTVGAEYRNEKGENEGNFDRSLINKAVYVNNILKFLQEQVFLNAGLRYDDHETFGNKTTYRIGAAYNIRRHALRIKSSYATGFRAPKFNELFFPFYGNPRLRPEECTSWEISMEKDVFKNMSVYLTYFDQRYKNLIQTDPFTFSAANISRAKVKGIEANTILKMTDEVTIKAGYMRLDTKDEATGQNLPFRPKDKFNLSAELSKKDISAIVNYTFVSKRLDSLVKRNLSSYSIVNVAGNYRTSKWMTLFMRIDNLLDEDYEEIGSYGTPGFSVFGGVRISI
ncbi:MAG: TonB-dependent receptor [Nitrospirae bacterium]|nr:TonB-dependent receptor [Nitrospirota bacterium]